MPVLFKLALLKLYAAAIRRFPAGRGTSADTSDPLSDVDFYFPFKDLQSQIQSANILCPAPGGPYDTALSLITTNCPSSGTDNVPINPCCTQDMLKDLAGAVGCVQGSDTSLASSMQSATKDFIQQCQQAGVNGPPTLPETASHTLHPSLASFSIETAFFIMYVGNTTSPNILTRDLLQNIKDRIGIPAEIRIGGITADSTFWDPSLEAAIFNFVDNTGALINTTIGWEFWDAARELLPEGTQITVNLNLESLNFTRALAVAESAVQGLPNQVAAFEIGNEPDHYFSFTAKNYSNIWEPWSKNISSALNFTTPKFQLAATADDPLWPYNTIAADAQLDCVSALAAGVDDANTVEWCSEHTYQYSVCDPTRTAIATLPNLMRNIIFIAVSNFRLNNTVRKQLGSQAFVIGEYNSVSCSGRDGVSNTFGQALWLLDTIFYAASLNVSRLYLHQGGPLALQSATQLNKGGFSFYDLWYPIDNLNGPVQVFPSYSAYLFVADTIGSSRSLKIANIYPGRQTNESTITTAGGDTSSGQLVIYGFWDESHPTG
ncbi:glycoside hydrolase family 79 protein [Lentinula edodes]|uniref:Glycoside hydrolase family 79 protein n=1 Tax=Lentinula edodes TaxID=5353 RepID=A0A1Q3EDM7_LENED|nr:glycoside hydrolase family 79 protein [Lentinula edodes]